MAKRKIIKIDEAKCNGCGLCIPNCSEGAIQLIDGKARLVSDIFCDGLGACLGHCPQGAITIEEREAEPFDEKKALAHHHYTGGCPGSKVIDLRKKESKVKDKAEAAKQESQLRQWPIQIMLIPPHAPYLKGADLLIAADCVPFAYADFHGDLLKGRTLLIGCPKFDDVEIYKEKISEIAKNSGIKSITYAHMEVPCCFGLVGIIKSAIADSGKAIPFNEVVISIGGEKMR